jgi:GxxExxY protein
MPIQDPLTQQIIGLSYRVANTLGHGFVENVYENSRAFELRRAKASPAETGMNAD